MADDDGDGTMREVSYYDYEIHEQPTNTLGTPNFKVEPTILNPGVINQLKISFTNIDISNTEEIWLEFETHDYINNIFDVDLGTNSEIPFNTDNTK